MNLFWKKAIRKLSRKGTSELYGKANYMPWLEKRIFLSPSNDGLVIGEGRLKRSDSYRHLGIIAPTGMGKSTKVIIKNLLRLKDTSAIVTDPSGELWRDTSGHLHSQGVQVEVINFTNARNSAGSNAYQYFQEMKDRRTIGNSIAEHISSSTGSDKFWIVQASNINYVLLSALQQFQSLGMGEYYNLFNFCALLQQLQIHGSSGGSIHDFLSCYLSPDQWRMYQTFQAAREDLKKDILATALTSLSCVAERDSEATILTSNNTLDLSVLRDKPTVVYLILPEDDVESFSLVVTLFYQAVFKVLKTRLNDPNKLPVYLFMDEFGNLGRFPNFNRNISTLRKYGVSVSVVLQDISQMYDIYGGHKARTILSGLGSKVYLPGIDDPETLKWVETLLGHETVVEMDSNGRYERKAGRPLKSASEIRTLYDDEAIFITKNAPAVLLKCREYFYDSTLRKRAKIPPYQPKYPGLDTVPILPLVDAPVSPPEHPEKEKVLVEVR